MIPKGSGPRLCILGKSAAAKEHEGGDQEARGTRQCGPADQSIRGKDGQEPIPARRTTFDIQPRSYHHQPGQPGSKGNSYQE